MAHRNLRIAELRPKHNPTKKELPAHDARAFYRAAVDAHSLGRGVPDDDAFFASVSRKGPGLAAASKSSTWNPPEPPAPGCRPDGVVPQEAQAEFIHCLFAYMHNLHHQKVSAYEKLEAAQVIRSDAQYTWNDGESYAFMSMERLFLAPTRGRFAKSLSLHRTASRTPGRECGHL